MRYAGPGISKTTPNRRKGGKGAVRETKGVMTPKQTNQPICLHCKAVISSAERSRIKLHWEPQGHWFGYAYSCPSCHAVLSIEYDPAGSQKPTIDAVQKSLDAVHKALDGLSAHIQSIGRKMRG